MNSSLLDKCSSEKDLGITFDESMKFDIHINTIIKKAHQMLGLIKRTFSYLRKDIFLKLYKALVRPHLEYGNVIWNPILKGQSIAIERIQRRATKLVKGCKNMSYDDRLKYLRLHSLKGRRTRGDLIQTYKIFNGIDDLAIDKFFMLSNVQSTRNPDRKIFKQHNTTNIRNHCYSNRIIAHWNLLPVTTKYAKSVEEFKKTLDDNETMAKLFCDYDE